MDTTSELTQVEYVTLLESDSASLAKRTGVSGALERQPYEAPAIIYEGEITTRAGSQFPGPKGEYDVDPSKLFGNVD